MKFDYCISNPAFNISESTNIAGTGGNTTLYRRATRYDFVNRVKPHGMLLNITLKGIIPDLVGGFFKDYSVHEINLMDNIKVWNYNTCFFIVEKSPRTTFPFLNGGLCSKIYSYEDSTKFPFVYYSGSNNSMDKHFCPTGSNTVIRKLPGKYNHTVVYDKTNKDIEFGPKFAFSVMESAKSYTVTSEPIFGGTIAYIPTSSIEEAHKLMLFTKNNHVYKLFIERMKQEKNYAFGLRNVKKFDITQIHTGYETPIEWDITEADLQEPHELCNDVIEDRSKVKSTGEVFTPTSLVWHVLTQLKIHSPNAFSDPSKTFLDSMCGNGQFLKEIFNQKIQHGIDPYVALQTIFGIELDSTNVQKCIERLAFDQKSFDIVSKQVVCADTFDYDFSFASNFQ